MDADTPPSHDRNRAIALCGNRESHTRLGDPGPDFIAPCAGPRQHISSRAQGPRRRNVRNKASASFRTAGACLDGGRADVKRQETKEGERRVPGLLPFEFGLTSWVQQSQPRGAVLIVAHRTLTAVRARCPARRTHSTESHRLHSIPNDDPRRILTHGMSTCLCRQTRLALIPLTRTSNGNARVGQ
jgi:hypothetical protein